MHCTMSLYPSSYYIYNIYYNAIWCSTLYSKKHVWAEQFLVYGCFGYKLDSQQLYVSYLPWSGWPTTWSALSIGFAVESFPDSATECEILSVWLASLSSPDCLTVGVIIVTPSLWWLLGGATSRVGLYIVAFCSRLNQWGHCCFLGRWIITSVLHAAIFSMFRHHIQCTISS